MLARSLTALCLTLLTPTAFGQSASRPQTFAEPESLEPWSFSNGPEWPGATGDLDWAPDAGRTGDGVLRLHYNFAQGGNYCAALRDLPTDPPVKAVRMWLNKPADNLMIIRAADSEGEVFQKNFRYHYAGWQQVEIALADWIFSWGGDDDFDWPATQLHILIERDGGNRQGILLIDDVRWVHQVDAEEGPGQLATTTYEESNFAPQDSWSVDGPATTNLAGRTLRYDFSEGTRCRLNWGKSILGQPTELQLVVESDGSGHELRAICGSHFQYFERSLGTLTRDGAQTFTVPMGNMTTWDHYGGQDDGIVRYPLRLMHIDLIKQSTPEIGQITLKRLAFKTRYDADFPVIMVPAVEPIGDVAANFSVTLRSLHDKPLTGMLDYQINALDHTRRRHAQQLEVPAGRSTTFELPFEFGEQTMLEATFDFTADGYRAKPASITIARAPAAKPVYKLAPDSRMGVGMYLYRFHKHPEAQQWMERMCRLAAAAGVKWTREEFHWNWIEPQQGEYDWAFFDQLVDTAYAHGISVYGLCCYYTEWNKPPITDEFIEHYCDYLRALVTRYKDRIKYWEIWNEPNIFFWPGTPEEYAQLLTRAYATIKAVDPEATVLGCSTAGIDTKFIKRIVELDAPFDDLTVHPYRHDLDPLGFIDELEKARQLVDGRDVWITEMGWPSQIGGLTERQQANFVARTYLAALAAPACRSVSWYDFREDGTDPFYNEHHFGLVRNDLTPKIGYRALAAVGQLVGDAKSARQIKLPGLLAFAYESRAQHVVALWSPDETKIVKLRLTAPESVDVRNAMNEPATVQRDGDTVVLRLEHNLPVYLVSAAPPQVRILPAPVELTLDRTAVHAGEQVLLSWDTQDGVTVLPPDAPRGWTVTANGRQAVRLTPPASARPGTYRLEIPIRLGDQEQTLTREIKLVPQLIRG